MTPVFFFIAAKRGANYSLEGGNFSKHPRRNLVNTAHRPLGAGIGEQQDSLTFTLLTILWIVNPRSVKSSNAWFTYRIECKLMPGSVAASCFRHLSAA